MRTTSRHPRAVPDAIIAFLALLGLAAAVLLLPAFPPDFRASVVAVALVAAGLAVALCCGVRARALHGRRRLPWALLSLAAVVAFLGNLWGGLAGSAPDDPSLVTNLSIAAALLISIGALIAFVGIGGVGRDHVVMVLDGFVVGGALVIIASAVIFPDLITAEIRGDLVAEATTLAFPLLDIVLATLSILVLARSPRSKRLPLAMVGLGFLSYAVSDIGYALGVAHGTYTYGSVLDLGWIVGYLLAASAALTPIRSTRDDDPALSWLPPTVIRTLVLGLTVGAVVVQAVLIEPGQLAVVSVVALVLVIIAAGARLILLGRDNDALRAGLERRVDEQTIDLQSMVSQQDALLSSVGEGIYGVDRRGRITFLNPAAARILGYTDTELQGAKAHEVFHVPDVGDEAHPWEACSVHRAVADATETTLQERYRLADGTIIPVESTTAPLFTGTEVNGAVVVFRGIGQRQEVDRMKNEFLSVVSHELRTPLTAILGSLEMIDSGSFGPLPAPVVELVGVASRSSSRLARLINDLLDFERIESGTQPMRLVTTGAPPLVVSAVQQVGGMAAQLGVHLETGVLDGAVTADEDQVVQTLINLLSNAVKFSPAGATVIAQSRVVGTEVWFEVIDHGRGIPADKLEAVFGRFEQVDSSDARVLGGTGLGLAISKSLVERHGGRIWAESELGVGTTMTVSLPAIERRSRKRREGRTVVVHDPDPAVVGGLSETLLRHGYGARGVTEPDELSDVLAAQSPALLLLDAAPDTAGAAVLRSLTSEPRHRDLAVVVVSEQGPGCDPDMAAATAGWLVAPVSERHLVDAVSTAMAGGATRGTVLLVEDDDDLAAVIGALLAEDGLTVLRAGTTAEAVALGQRIAPAVVVLDLMLPDGDGEEVVADLRRCGILPKARLVVYSALPAPAEHDPDLGADVYLQKSRVPPTELRARVLALVAASGAHQPADGTQDPPTTGAAAGHAADRHATPVIS